LYEKWCVIFWMSAQMKYLPQMRISTYCKIVPAINLDYEFDGGGKIEYSTKFHSFERIYLSVFQKDLSLYHIHDTLTGL